MFPGSLVVFQLSYVSAADDVGPCNAHPSLHLRGGAWQWEGGFGDPFKVGSHPWLVLIAQTVVEHLCVYVILIHHLRQFYSLSADLEKTRQALLIATVKLFSSVDSNVYSIDKENGDFSRLPKKMGHVYSMAMIRWVQKYTLSSWVDCLKVSQGIVWYKMI